MYPCRLFHSYCLCHRYLRLDTERNTDSGHLAQSKFGEPQGLSLRNPPQINVSPSGAAVARPTARLTQPGRYTDYLGSKLTDPRVLDLGYGELDTELGGRQILPSLMTRPLHGVSRGIVRGSPTSLQAVRTKLSPCLARHCSLTGRLPVEMRSRIGTAPYAPQATRRAPEVAQGNAQ